MNPNLSTDPKTDKEIPYCEDMPDHAVFVWEKYVLNSGFKNILLIAHSAGGGCTRAIQTKFADTFYNQVKEIAYTDSWVIEKEALTPGQIEFMEKRAIHYVSSNNQLGTLESTGFGGRGACPHVSAGHPKHEYTTGFAWPMIIQQFDRENTHSYKES